jgi:hypothetical protein
MQQNRNSQNASRETKHVESDIELRARTRILDRIINAFRLDNF